MIPKNKTRKFSIFILCFTVCIVASGCTTYKMLKSSEYNNGYVFSRSTNIIPEYTVDEKNKAPEDEELAKERFKRRWKKVEYYYKNMEYISGTFRSYWNYMKVYLMLPLSPIIVPKHAWQQYRYTHNPEYKAMVDKKDDEEEEQRREKIAEFKKGLYAYILKDIEFEKSKNPTGE